MAESVFDVVSEELERLTAFERLEARGTVRLTLKEAGLDAQEVTSQQMKVVIEKLMPRELTSRGVPDASNVCAALIASVDQADPGAARSESPEDIFRRLAGGS